MPTSDLEAHPPTTGPQGLESRSVPPWSFAASGASGVEPTGCLASSPGRPLPRKSQHWGEVWEKSPCLLRGEAGQGMRNFGDSVDGSRLGQTLSGAACRGFVQTSSRRRKRNARGGRLRYILDRSKDVLTLVTHSEKDEAGAELGRVPEEGSEPPARIPRVIHGHPCRPGGWASLLPSQAGSLDPCEALPGPAVSGFHQTSKSRLYYYCYCYCYQAYVFSDDRSTSGLL